MRKSKLFIGIVLVLILVFALTACKPPVQCTEHIDENKDGKCDVCKTNMPSVQPCTSHTDANSDGKCDNCGADMNLPPCVTHTDANSDGKCDNCGADVVGNVDTYVVTFDLNYEGKPASILVDTVSGDAVELPQTPLRKNYLFTFWYEDAECTTRFDLENAIEENITLYAGWQLVSVDVIFDSKGGSAVASQEVEINGKATQPTNPTLEGFVFSSWCSDSACETTFDFNTEITAPITLYAKWEEDKGDNITVKYMYNYENSPTDGIYYQTEIAIDTAVADIAAPARAAKTDGTKYVFDGWYTDAACTTVFNKATALSVDTVVYAKWLTRYVFEAEYVDLEDKEGRGYSGGAFGSDMAVADTYGANASNGYFVTYLYYYDAFIQFDITSSKAVDDAVIELRLSVEYRDFTLNNDTFLVIVNGIAINYTPVALTGSFADTEDEKRAFEDYDIAIGVDLKEGVNIIELVVNNEVEYDFGTMQALAPTIDCLYITTDATLTWQPVLSNIED